MASTMALLSLPPLPGGRPRAASVRPPRAANWFAPIFGLPAEPDYVDRPVAASVTPPPPAAAEAEAKRRRGVVFTDEKARKLRMSMMKTSNFHDAMYHSAIASRLASDFKDLGSDQI